MATFPEEPEKALAIAEAESEYNPDAYNPEGHNGCSGSVGLFQIACVNYQGNKEDLKDVRLNLKIARKIYDNQGWEPWGAYTDGRYLSYLR